jgi:hypothetical protein
MTSIVPAIVFTLVSQAVAPTTPQPQAASKCPVSQDDTYGFTRENPVQIGGGALYVKAREQRYLDALRGPDGQSIQYKRVGSLPQSTNSRTILDLYEVTYGGLEKPISLYLDAYHFWEQRAPKGLICGQPFNLQPTPDAFQASDSLLGIALEQGAARDFAPIPLGADGSTANGMLWDGFRMLALAARTAAAAGSPLPPTARPDGGTVVLAVPLSCEGRTVAPIAIDLLPQQGAAVQRTGAYIRDADIQNLLPGTTAAPGSLAARFALQQVRPTDRVKITYAEPACPGGMADVLLPLKMTPVRGTEMPPPVLPSGAKAEENRVLLQVMIDLDGALQRPSYAGGPAHLQQPAIEAVKTWRAEPARVNGAPVATAMLVEVEFKPPPK